MRLIGLLALVLALATLACNPSALVRDVSPAQVTLTPNGDGLDDEAFVSYRLTQPARISAWLEDSAGNRYVLRRDEPRSAGDYSLRVNGAYAPDPDLATQRVLPDTAYTLTIQASDGLHEEAQQTQIIIQDADTNAPGLLDVALQRPVISPNGDAVDDDTFISYRLSKPALLSITITDTNSNTFPLIREEQKNAVADSFRWDGTTQGQLLPDGSYLIHLLARDPAGNVTESLLPIQLVEGGTPKLEIVESRITPKAVPKGGLLQVEIRARNTGDTVIHTSCPAPGASYTTDDNFIKYKADDGQPSCFERAGVWRVGVGWDQADRPFPARWSLGKDLAPGEEATITGTIQVNIDRVQVVRFWAGVEQGGVGFPGGQVGITQVTVSY
jgi:hypothetical protein